MKRLKSIKEWHAQYVLTLRPVIIRNGKHVGIGGKWS